MRGVADSSGATPELDAAQRYKDAVALAEKVRQEWKAGGSPLLVEWSNGNVSEHPLVKLLRECERDCDRFARVLVKRQMGRKPSAVITETGGLPPPLKLAEMRQVRGK